jgi:hypothetical protein
LSSTDRELVRHAGQEPSVPAAFLQQDIFGDWHRNLAALLRAAIAQDQLRADLDPESAASVLMTFILGLGMTLLVPVPTASEQMLAQLERWLAG